MTKNVFAARHVSITIHRPPAVVQRFIADGSNMPAWRPGFSSRKEGDEWVADVHAGEPPEASPIAPLISSRRATTSR
jgi:hypothetical protein